MCAVQSNVALLHFYWTVLPTDAMHALQTLTSNTTPKGQPPTQKKRGGEFERGKKEDWQRG
jgi:hypothetical protein